MDDTPLHSPLLDEDAVRAVFDDVWPLQSPPCAPASLSIEAGTVSTAEKTKKKRRRDRNRPWHEIARLQSEAAELERQLQDKSATANKKARLRLHVYTRNIALKRMLRDNLSTIRALEQNLNTQIDEFLQAAPHSLVKFEQNLPYDAAQDKAVFMWMARSVDDQYSDMDQALQLAKLNEATSEVADAVICRSNGNCGALWRYLDRCEGATLGTRSRLDLPLGISSRIAIQKFEVALGDFVCIMRMVTKQFIEKNRVVHVWDVLADWRVGAACYAKTCERGWGFIQPMNHDEASVCLSYSLMDLTNGYSLSENGDALIKLYHRFMISRLQALENQALEQQMQEEKNSITS